MELRELNSQAIRIHDLYDELNRRERGRTWTREEFVLGFMGDVGDLAKLVMAELPEVDPEDERFTAKMTVFSELIDHHVEEEEKEMFKLAKKLPKEDLEDLGERMAAHVRQVKGEEALYAPRRRQPVKS